jgi:hypothetical protein
VQAEGHEWEFEEAEWSGYSGLLYVFRVDRDFVVGSHQANSGKGGTAEKLVGVVVDMADRVAVRDGSGVKRSVIAAWAKTVVFFGHDVQCRGPGTL